MDLGLTIMMELSRKTIQQVSIVKLRSRSRSGDGQEGQSQVKSSTENRKIIDLIH